VKSDVLIAVLVKIKYSGMEKYKVSIGRY